MLLHQILLSSLLTMALFLSNKICFAHHQDEKEEWEPVSAGSLITWTAPLCDKSKFVI